MNVAFFLTPKSEVVCVLDNATMRAAMEQMDQSGYTAVPVLDPHGGYVGTLTEGDLLRKLLRTPKLTFVGAEHVTVSEVPRRTNVQAVGIDAQMEELFSRALEQNFVPVVDSRNVFIGIVRRRAILEYYAKASTRPAQ